VEDLSFVPTASVDKIFHMNCIYFWPGIVLCPVFVCAYCCSSVAAATCSVAARYCTLSCFCARLLLQLCCSCCMLCCSQVLYSVLFLCAPTVSSVDEIFSCTYFWPGIFSTMALRALYYCALLYDTLLPQFLFFAQNLPRELRLL
jgi:hypothetical protein